MSVITIERKILEKNDEIARENRRVFHDNNLLVLNMVSSPGSGKTSLLERTIEYLKETVKIGVIEGDVQTDLDARRIAAYGVPAVQIVTRGGCHLEANLIRDALMNIDLAALQLLFIENVGNLVCPANYDLGETMKVVVLSTTEGDDKPLKYPAMFRNAGVMVINKIDLLPHLTTDITVLQRNALQINPSLEIFATSCSTTAGIREWCEWIRSRLPRKP